METLRLDQHNEADLDWDLGAIDDNCGSEPRHARYGHPPPKHVSPTAPSEKPHAGQTNTRPPTRIADAPSVKPHAGQTKRLTKTLYTKSDIQDLYLWGKTDKEIITLFGKPSYLSNERGGYYGGLVYDETWEYRDIIRHENTGMTEELEVMFNDGKVVGVAIGGGDIFPKGAVVGRKGAVVP